MFVMTYKPAYKIKFILPFLLSFFFAGFAAGIKIDRTDYKINKVVIDAGHGGQDPGAVGLKSKEKDVVLAVALKVGAYITENFPDVEVIYTRKEDVFVPLHERAAIGTRNKADLFISIHANANKKKEIFGAETYVMGLHANERNLEVAQKENAVIVLENDYNTKYEGYDPNSSESFIIFSLMQNAYLDQSLQFAALTQDEFRERAKRYDRGVKQAGFLVLWKSAMPSVLIELGYISNPNEEAYLTSTEGQDYLASSIFRAFKAYKIKRENKIITSPYSDTIAKKQVETEPKTIEIQSTESNPTNEKQNTNTDSVIFRLQIGTSSKPLANKKTHFKNLSQIDADKSLEEIQVGNLYKYYIGASTNYKQLVELNRKAKTYFPDAFIVAWKNDTIMPLKEALKLQK